MYYIEIAYGGIQCVVICYQNSLSEKVKPAVALAAAGVFDFG